MKSKITIAGKTYRVEINNGERFIDGWTVEQFMEKLGAEAIEQCAIVGHRALQDEINGTATNLQDLANALHSEKAN